MRFKNILITGANGFIGNHLVNELFKDEYKLTILDREFTNNELIEHNDISKIVWDISRGNESKKQIPKDIDAVIHLASYVHKVPRSKEDEDVVKKINVDGLRNFLNVLPKTVEKFIFFSSVSVYGVQIGTGIAEDFPTKPVTMYGKTKLQAEKIIETWGKQNNVITTSFRLPVVYGPGVKGNFLKLIRLIDKGLYLPIGTGENQRSMINVKNIVDAVKFILNKQKMDSNIYNVTDGMDYSIGEIYRIVTAELGKKKIGLYIPITLATNMAKIVDKCLSITRFKPPFLLDSVNKLTGSLIFSSEKIYNEIGFKPKHDIYSEIKETIDCYLINKNKTV